MEGAEEGKKRGGERTEGKEEKEEKERDKWDKQ